MTTRSVSPELSLYRAQRVRELDGSAIAALGIPSFALMSRAGEVAFRVLAKRWPEARRVAVLCGLGNNGGDGYVIARLAKEAGIAVQVLYVGERDKLKGDALEAAHAYYEAGGAEARFEPGRLRNADILVDALLGTGLERPVEGLWREAVEAVNGAGRPVLAVDLPSGLSADTGVPLGAAVQANATVSFVGLKRGMFTGSGPACCGDIVFDRLGAPTAVYDSAPPDASLIDTDAGTRLLAPRRRDAHKGHFGHVLVVGGGGGLGGAARMAGEAAARVGAGLVSLAIDGRYTGAITAVRPELMCHAVDGAADLQGPLERATLLALGPGLGRDDRARALWGACVEVDVPLVLDADALNLLAEQPRQRADWVLTPHPGEAARLLGSDAKTVQADRFAAVEAIQQRYGGVCVLKGAGTLVADGEHSVAVCRYGNPGMASGGMGDVLTGVIAGLRAQGLSAWDASCLGTAIHARAGDAAAAEGERGLLASDLLVHLRRLVNPAAAG